MYLVLIEMPDEKINSYYENNKLHYLFTQTIKNLFSKRGWVKKYDCGRTHPLNECCNYELNEDYPVNEEIEQQLFEPIQVERIKTEIINGLEINDHDTQVFVMAQIEQVTSISRRTGITRQKLHQSINNVKVRLRNL